MEFEYVGYNAEKRVTRGKITADGEKDAGEKLSRNGYQVLSLKATGLAMGFLALSIFVPIYSSLSLVGGK